MCNLDRSSCATQITHHVQITCNRSLIMCKSRATQIVHHVQITCNTDRSSRATQIAHHVQHVVCHLVWRDSSAIAFDKSWNSIYLSFNLLAEPLTDEGREGNRSTQRKPLVTSFTSKQKNTHTTRSPQRSTGLVQKTRLSHQPQPHSWKNNNKQTNKKIP